MSFTRILIVFLSADSFLFILGVRDFWAFIAFNTLLHALFFLKKEDGK